MARSRSRGDRFAKCQTNPTPPSAQRQPRQRKVVIAHARPPLVRKDATWQQQSNLATTPESPGQPILDNDPGMRLPARSVVVSKQAPRTSRTARSRMSLGTTSARAVASTDGFRILIALRRAVRFAGVAGRAETCHCHAAGLGCSPKHSGRSTAIAIGCSANGYEPQAKRTLSFSFGARQPTRARTISGQ